MFTRSFSAVVVCAVLLGTGACEERKGPVERAGEKVDKAMDKAGDHLKDAADQTKDAAKGR